MVQPLYERGVVAGVGNRQFELPSAVSRHCGDGVFRGLQSPLGFVIRRSVILQKRDLFGTGELVQIRGTFSFECFIIGHSQTHKLCVRRIEFAAGNGGAETNFPTPEIGNVDKAKVSGGVSGGLIKRGSEGSAFGDFVELLAGRSNLEERGG
ncbi:hypothetical protein F3Y22_tig00110793pilonHSYRG00032 [Hibiscus syriacus]|uniref:Uncharacterized protein n=1 Tax=Hibiscus syriacus TaxID=106335 RepID=A0A6A2ZQS3_HIBSY|nr:hypothetical protein F3Y22_tig00110793pilonHSYRG00032 [Hibiscus syriacus]